MFSKHFFKSFKRVECFLQTLTFLPLFLLLSCQTEEQSPSKKAFRIPAEFEPQDAVWLGFETLESSGDSQADSITLEMIRAIHPYVDVNLIIEHDTLVGDIKGELYAKGIDTTHINLIFQANTDVWYRDPGPIFCITPDNELGIIDFKYTSYSNISHDSISERAKLYEALDRDVAGRMNTPTFESKIALEGGAIETNGRGTLIVVEELMLGRNPHLTKEEVEEEFAQCCGIEKVIWLPKGVADDPHNVESIVDNVFGLGTGGHTDEFVRFANDSTILLSWVEEEERSAHPLSKMNYEILRESYSILSEAVDATGRKFTIIKVPHPSPYLDPFLVTEKRLEREWWKEQLEVLGSQVGDTLLWSYARSYLNYQSTNGIILLPEYASALPADAKKDSIVHSLFQSLYPDRKIVGINPLVFNGNGGGMHCRFQTQPSLN
jgi:agmatine deiminase